jgi:hypothetical protein
MRRNGGQPRWRGLRTVLDLFTMLGKHASPTSERLPPDSKRRFESPAARIARAVIGAGVWALAVSGTQLFVGDAIGLPMREREERLEQELKARGAPPPDSEEPARTHEDAIEPWELVGV